MTVCCVFAKTWEVKLALCTNIFASLNLSFHVGFLPPKSTTLFFCFFNAVYSVGSLQHVSSDYIQHKYRYPAPPPIGWHFWHVTLCYTTVLELSEAMFTQNSFSCRHTHTKRKLPTHPTPNPGFSLTCDLRAETWVWGGVGGQFPTNLNWSQEAIRYWMNTYTILEVSFGWVVCETSSLKKADLSASLNYVN